MEQINTPRPSATTPPAPVTLRADTTNAIQLERRGRAWLLWSFLLCPCHLPLTLSVLGTVLASTSVGVGLREHTWLAGTIVTAGWILGTGYGLRLIRRAERANGACDR